MTLFNSENPRIRQAQARTLDTLMAIPDEYGAVFVIDEYQTELTEAVRAHTRREAVEQTAKRHESGALWWRALIGSAK